MLRRGFGLFFLALAGLGIYALGYWQGQQVQSQAHMAYSRVDGAMVGRAVDASAAAGETAMGGTPAVSPGFDELLDAAAWFKLERWLVANNPVIDYSHGARLIKSLGAQVNKYDALAMRRVLRAYLDAQPNDAGLELRIAQAPIDQHFGIE